MMRIDLSFTLAIAPAWIASAIGPLVVRLRGVVATFEANEATLEISHLARDVRKMTLGQKNTLGLGQRTRGVHWKGSSTTCLTSKVWSWPSPSTP